MFCRVCGNLDFGWKSVVDVCWPSNMWIIKYTVLVSVHQTRDSHPTSSRPLPTVWSSFKTLQACLLYFPLHPRGPTEQININTRKRHWRAPGCCSPKIPEEQMADGHRHPSNTPLSIICSDPDTHQTSRADDSRPPWSLTVLSLHLPHWAS